MTIDVAFVYTPAARERAGGTAAIEAVIDLMIAETNQVYAESGVRHRMALVARSEVPYTETGDSLRRSILPVSRIHRTATWTRRTPCARPAGPTSCICSSTRADVGGLAYLGGAFGLTCAGHLLPWQESSRMRPGHNLGLRHDRYEIAQNIREDLVGGSGLRLCESAGVRAQGAPPSQ